MRKVLVVLLLLISFNGYSPSFDKQTRVNKFNNCIVRLRIKEIKQSEFNTKLLVEYLNLKYPESNDVPLRQFILETGWFTHPRFTEYNNIAGMRLAKIRETTAVGEWKEHAVYNHWTCSIDDYYLWLTYYTEKGYITQNSSNISYYTFLDSVGYATANNYIEILKQINLKRLT